MTFNLEQFEALVESISSKSSYWNKLIRSDARLDALKYSAQALLSQNSSDKDMAISQLTTCVNMGTEFGVAKAWMSDMIGNFAFILKGQGIEVPALRVYNNECTLTDAKTVHNLGKENHYWLRIPSDRVQEATSCMVDALNSTTKARRDLAVHMLSSCFSYGVDVNQSGLWAKEMVGQFALTLEAQGIDSPVLAVYKSEHFLKKEQNIHGVGANNAYWQRIPSDLEGTATYHMSQALGATNKEEREATVRHLSTCFPMHLSSRDRLLWAKDMVTQFAQTIKAEHQVEVPVMSVITEERSSLRVLQKLESLRLTPPQAGAIDRAASGEDKPVGVCAVVA